MQFRYSFIYKLHIVEVQFVSRRRPHSLSSAQPHPRCRGPNPTPPQPHPRAVKSLLLFETLTFLTKSLEKLPRKDWEPPMKKTRAPAVRSHIEPHIGTLSAARTSNRHR